MQDRVQIFKDILEKILHILYKTVHGKQSSIYIYII